MAVRYIKAIQKQLSIKKVVYELLNELNSSEKIVKDISLLWRLFS